MTRFTLTLALGLLAPMLAPAAPTPPKTTLFAADNPNIQYTGRIDFGNPKKPRFWAPGVYVTMRFAGPSCAVVVNDEMLGGSKHNYLEVVVDGKLTRLQLTGKENTVPVASNLAAGPHTLTICKNTESNIGYLECVGVRCAKLLLPPARPARRIEFIGNSITCGTGSDESVVPCGKGQWHDQHNAYMAYGSTTARAVAAHGDAAVRKFFFSHSYNSGCDNHPSLAEHQLIGAELTAYLKNTLRW